MPLIGGIEIRERMERRPGEPRYKRLDFVRPKRKYYVDGDEWQLVKKAHHVEHRTIHSGDRIIAPRYRQLPPAQIHQHPRDDWGHGQPRARHSLDQQPYWPEDQGRNNGGWQGGNQFQHQPPMQGPAYGSNDMIPVPPMHGPPRQALPDPMHHRGGDGGVRALGPAYHDDDPIYEIREPRNHGHRSQSRPRSVVMVPNNGLSRSRSAFRRPRGESIYSSSSDEDWRRGRSRGRYDGRSNSRPRRAFDDDMDGLIDQFGGMGFQRRGGHVGW